MGVGSQRHDPTALPPGYPLYRRVSGPQGRSGRVWKISPPPGFDPRIIQPVSTHPSMCTVQNCVTPMRTKIKTPVKTGTGGKASHLHLPPKVQIWWTYTSTPRHEFIVCKRINLSKQADAYTHTHTHTHLYFARTLSAK